MRRFIERLRSIREFLRAQPGLVEEFVLEQTSGPGSLKQRLMKTGCRLVKHARYYWLLLAEGNLTRSLFGVILQRLTALSVPAG